MFESAEVVLAERIVPAIHERVAIPTIEDQSELQLETSASRRRATASPGWNAARTCPAASVSPLPPTSSAP
jgi:hypothetical protein